MENKLLEAYTIDEAYVMHQLCLQGVAKIDGNQEKDDRVIFIQAEKHIKGVWEFVNVNTSIDEAVSKYLKKQTNKLYRLECELIHIHGVSHASVYQTDETTYIECKGEIEFETVIEINEKAESTLNNLKRGAITIQDKIVCLSFS